MIDIRTCSAQELDALNERAKAWKAKNAPDSDKQAENPLDLTLPTTQKPQALVQGSFEGI